MTIFKFIKSHLIFIIIILGLFTRLYRLKDTFSWGSEQALSLIPIIQMFEEQKIPLIGIHLINYKSALFRPPFFIYIFAIPFKLAHFNPLVLEILLCLIGTVNIYVLYLIAKKNINKVTAFISALVYATNLFIIKTDKTIWTITPIIITSSLIFYYLSLFLHVNRKVYAFIVGSLIGLGFSFHFQAAILMLSVSIIFIKNYRKYFLFYLIGIIIFISPLLIFNIRHNFIMINGLKNLVAGDYVITRQNTTILGKLNNGLSAFSDLGLFLLLIPAQKNNIFLNIFIIALLLIIPSIFQYKNSKKKHEKILLQIFFLNCGLSILFLSLIDQGIYSSTAFYLWFLIPSIMLMWARFAELMINTKLKPIITLSIFIFVSYNLFFIKNQQKTDYLQKLELIDYVLTEAHWKNITLKLINRDALIYNPLFYYRSAFFGKKYSQLNLLEQWQNGNPNFYIIEGNYNWEEDRYKIYPYSKIKEFGDTKVIVKSTIN